MSIPPTESSAPAPILPRIGSPADLRSLSIDELVDLCGEIRRYLIETVSLTGGHFAPNLGVVELTVALHRVLDTPRDQIVWDVGHQCYPHKILTGRREELRRVKQYGGISGYPKIDESPYDTFGTGHASTSISAALGMAVARDLRGEKHRVVTVTGDGAMTGGMAYEALNNAGMLKRDLLVILNDNSMSIAPNVGAISAYLTQLTSSRTYNHWKEEVRGLVESIPRVGHDLAHYATKFEALVKHFMVPGALFEAMGFRYFGPIDGHDLPNLISVLENLGQVRGPALLHLKTQKGRGYAFAEENPYHWHGVTPFHIQEGKPSGKSAGISWSKLFGETMVELCDTFPDLFGITAAMPDGTGLQVLHEKRPERFFDVGIAEQHAVTFAAGLARAGTRPVAAIYSTFLQRAYDQCLHDVALQSLPVVFAMDRAGLVGADGPTQHGAFDISFLRPLPNFVVSAPKDGVELRDLLYTALVQRDRPFSIRYPRGSSGLAEVPRGGFRDIPIGTWEVLREGKGTWVLAVGSMVPVALAAADERARAGQQVGVVNARFLRPMDDALLHRLISDARVLVTIEENALAGGFGSAVAEVLADSGAAGCTLVRLGIPDRFVTHGTPQELLDEVGLNAARLSEVLAVHATVGERRVAGG